jgi:hypothetical protein
MSPRAGYTRPEVAALLGVTERSLVRWHQEGKHFHPWRDPSDPSGRRWLYDRNEVDNYYRRRKRRGSGSYRIEDDRDEPDREPSPTEAKSPDSMRTRLDRMLREIGKLVGSERAAGTAAEKAKTPKTPSEEKGPSEPEGRAREPDATDRELERWTRDVDERKRLWEEAHRDDPSGDTGEDTDDKAAPSSRRSGSGK